jgi:hypothetical protein
VSDSTNLSPNSSSGAHANGAGAPGDDFVDFYELLGSQTEATTTALRRRINELYSEAQNNRDHRNPSRRRHYEALCELLPYCRIVLLDPDKRARYDRYMEQAKAGTSVPDFESMMDEIAGSIGEVSGEGEEKIGLLGTHGDDNYLPQKDAAAAAAAAPVKPSAKRAQAQTATEGVTPSAQEADAITLTGRAGQKRRLSKTAAASLMGSALSVIIFAIVCVAVYVLTRDIHNAILFAGLAGLLMWIVTHLRRGGPSNRISS